MNQNNKILKSFIKGLELKENKVIVKILNKLIDKNIISDDEKEQCKEILGELDIEIRICSECGRFMYEGYCIEGGDGYFCNDECLYKNMTREEFDELYADGEGDSYYTEW